MCKQIPYLNLMRLFSIFFVIIIHVVAPVFSDIRSSFTTIQIANAFDSLARVSVPIFVMISGALLLSREITIESILKRIIRVLIPLLFWSFIYSLYLNYWSQSLFDTYQAIRAIFTSPVMYHLWFVYMMIGFYILLPIVQPIAIKLLSNEKLSIYFFIIWFMINSLTIYFPISVLKYFVINNFMAWNGYFFLGYYLANREIFFALSVRKLIVIYFLTCFCTFCFTWYFNTNFNPLNEIAYNYFSPNVLVGSVALFLLFKKIKISFTYNSFLEFASSLVFSVYFMYLLIIAILTGGYLGFSIDQFTVHPAIGIFLLSVLTLCLCLSALGKQIPYLRKMIG